MFFRAACDLSGLPARRVTALARYADQAWATQLADLGGTRRVATLLAYTHLLTSSARDDVIDIFDVVFGDLQRSATHRGQQRRAVELRDYGLAVGEVHARMRGVPDVLDAQPVAVAGVLDALRTRLRRRDIYAPASSRWGDPRAELLAPGVWEDQREARPGRR